ncbi:MAG: DUF262 domain-containing protein [Terriglobia bacterium]
MEIQQGQRTVKSLIGEFNAGDIQLPPFQRPYVWKIRKTLNLLDSLYRGYPVGSIYLWKPSAKSKLKPKHHPTGKKHADFTHYLIDGQQRLTSLIAAFGLSEIFDPSNGRSLECSLELATDDSEGDGIRLTRLFHSPANKSEGDGQLHDAPTRVWLRVLAAGDPIDRVREDKKAELKGVGKSKTEIEKATERIDQAYRIMDRTVPVFTIECEKDDEVVAMFKRLNGGAGLRRGDIQAADLGRGPSVSVLERIRAFVGEHDQKSQAARVGFNFGFAFRALVVFHTGHPKLGDNQKADWARTRDGQTLMQSWQRAEKGLEKAIEFVVTELGWSRRGLLPSANALIPMAAAIEKTGGPMTKTDRLNYTRWLCLTALRGVFGSSVETRINEFVREVKKPGGTPSARLFGALAKANRPIKASELLEEVSPWGGGTQVLLAYLVQAKAKDWKDGVPLSDLARAKTHMPASHTGDLSVHHILPREKAESWGATAEDVNCIANYAIISRGLNSDFKHRSPDEVFDNELAWPHRKRAATQFFDQRAVDLLKKDGYEVFRKDRAKRLATHLNQWLQLGR